MNFAQIIDGVVVSVGHAKSIPASVDGVTFVAVASDVADLGGLYDGKKIVRQKGKKMIAPEPEPGPTLAELSAKIDVLSNAVELLVKAGQ